MTHYFIIIAYFIIFFTFSIIFHRFTDFSLCLPCCPWFFTLSLLRVSIPRKPAVGSGGGCSLSSRTANQPKNKIQNTLDYKIVPVGGVEPPFEPCRARDGVGVSAGSAIIWFVVVWCDAQLHQGHLSQNSCVHPRTG